MNAPFQLLRTAPSRTDADAFVLFTSDSAVLGRACEALAADSPPGVYRIHGGFLLVPARPSSAIVPGASRLRRLANHFYIPIDANLSPALLPDEFAGLTRQHGLIVLPHGTFGYDHAQPVSIQEWLTVTIATTGEWISFPEPPSFASALRTIERPAPPSAILEVLQSGSPENRDALAGPGEPWSVPESARPPSAPTFTRIGAGAMLGVAQLLAAVGRVFRLSGLSKTGADLARKAMEKVPRLSESVLGSQEAALREVLRQLQSGNAEQALRRAPIAVADPNQPSRAASDSQLSDRNPWYSLRELLGSSGGVANTWHGGGDVWLELQTEYRRMADAAIRRGDYRRAAYLHGVLLRDLRTAANVLMAGGFYRDAGLIFREKLRDDAAAANAFELAGDYDEAVRLYRKLGQELKAADLLQRIGEESQAAELYLVAIEKLAHQNQHLVAGDLAQSKLGRTDLAVRMYRAGWDADHTGAIACAERLIDHFLIREDWPGFDTFLSEARTRFRPPRASDAGRFFNSILSNRSQCLTPERAADLRDFIRLDFAEHIRKTSDSERSETQSKLFRPQPPNWSPTIQRDAAYASRLVAKNPKLAPVGTVLARGKVCAVANAESVGILFVATSNSVVAWNTATGQSNIVAEFLRGSIIGISTDPEARRLYCLVDQTSNLLLTLSMPMAERNRYQLVATTTIDCIDSQTAYLPPQWFPELTPNIVVGMDGRRHGFHGSMLIPSFSGPFEPEAGPIYLLAASKDEYWDCSDAALIRSRPRKNSEVPTHWESSCKHVMSWQPKSTLGIQPALDWIHTVDDVFRIAAVDTTGRIRLAEITMVDDSEERHTRHFLEAAGHEFTAVCFISPQVLACSTTANEIIWVEQATAAKLLRIGNPVTIDTPGHIVYLATNPSGNELHVVTSEAVVIPIAVPIGLQSLRNP